MKLWKLTSAAIAFVLISTNANAALIGRLPATEGGADFQAYYDTDADLTWLSDANYALTSGYHLAAFRGQMNWFTANTWAESLIINGVDGWRLPDTILPDQSCDTTNALGESYGFNCTGSELGNLFYNVLGNSAGELTNTGPFSNLTGFYWSATEVASVDVAAWGMNIFGQQTAQGKNLSFFGWAVHSGDVSAVPIPASVWLFFSGLISLIGVIRINNKNNSNEKI